MKTKWIFSLLLIFAYQTAPCQDTELSKEEFNMMSEFVHEMCKALFVEKNYAYKEAPYDPEDFFGPVPSTEKIKTLLQIIRKNGKIFIEKEDFGPELAFTAELGSDYSNLQDIIDKIDLEEANLKDKNGRAVQMKGIFQNYSFSEKINFKARIDEETYDSSGPISGSATYTLRFLTGYDQVTLSKDNIGETFELNNCSLKLVAIIHNQIILEPLCNGDLSVKLINFAKENTVFESYAYDELLEMNKKDPTVNTEGAFTQSSQTLDKTLYELFKKNPEISLKKFRKMLTAEEIKRLEKQESTYLILEHVAPIGNQFVLFTPTFRSEKLSFSIN